MRELVTMGALEHLYAWEAHPRRLGQVTTSVGYAFTEAGRYMHERAFLLRRKCGRFELVDPGYPLSSDKIT